MFFLAGNSGYRCARAQANQPARVRFLVDTGADVPFSFIPEAGVQLLRAHKLHSEGIKKVYGQWYRIDAIHIGSFWLDSCLVAYPTRIRDVKTLWSGRFLWTGRSAVHRDL
jgi:hypothetical protein